MSVEPSTPDFGQVANSDTTVYVVAYPGGFSEEVVGLEAARMRIIRPETRAEGMPQDTIGTYQPKRDELG